jgi:hypothetical protein
MKATVHLANGETLDVEIKESDFDSADFVGALWCTDVNTQWKYPVNLSQVLRITRSPS